jgi:hypothetical protein
MAVNELHGRQPGKKIASVHVQGNVDAVGQWVDPAAVAASGKLGHSLSDREAARRLAQRAGSDAWQESGAHRLSLLGFN